MLRQQIRAMDFLGIKIKALVHLLEEACLVASSKSKPLLILASKTSSLQLVVDFLEGLLTRQINHKIIQEGYLEDNNNNLQEEAYLDKTTKLNLVHRVTHNRMDSLDSPRTDKVLARAQTKCNKCTSK